MSFSLVGELPRTVERAQSKSDKDHNIASGGRHFEKFREVRFESNRRYRASKHHSTMGQLPDLKHLNLERTKLERLPREGYNLT